MGKAPARGRRWRPGPRPTMMAMPMTASGWRQGGRSAARSLRVRRSWPRPSSSSGRGRRRGRALACSTELDPRVEDAVEQVDEQVDHDVDDGHDDADARDGRQVEVRGADVGVLADAGPAKMFSTSTVPESRFPKARPATVAIESKRRPHHVAADDRPLRQPLGSGGPDVVVVYDFEHRGAGEAEHDPDREQAEHHPGHDQVLEGVDEQRKLAVEQGVDGVEAGDRRGRV